VFLLLALVLLLFLPSPWNVVGLIACLFAFVGELAFWRRRVKPLEVRAGSETLIGQSGRVLTACRPEGHVEVAGERWLARCAAGADAGQRVTVVGRERLLLIVEPEANTD
jgi:membrane protein implicated in regulation of membrane protease activity